MAIKRRKGDGDLDSRDLQICRMLDEGSSQAEIVRVMRVSPVTVTQMRSALREIDAEDQA